MNEHRMTPARHREFVQQLFLDRIPEIRRFAGATLPDLSLVDEVVQETFRAITADAVFYDPTQSFTAWLHPHVRRTVIEVGRRLEAGSQPFSAEVLDSLTASQPERAAPATLRRFMKECVEELAPQARKIIDLRYRKALKPREVAKLIGWTKASVHVTLSRSRAALRKCLDSKLAVADGDVWRKAT